jgi:DNA-binding CsgD family transcriptional regulator
MDMQPLIEFSALLEKVYGGATNPQAWPEIVKSITQWMDGDKAVIFTPAHRMIEGGFIFDHNVGHSYIEQWSSKFQPHDVLTQRAFEKGKMVQGNIILSQDLIEQDELRQTFFYREFLVPQNIEYLANGIVFGNNNAGLMPLSLSVFRGIDRPPFDEVQRQQLQLLTPHLSRSLGVMMTLRTAELRAATTLSVLDTIKSGVILLNANGEISYANPVAEKILQRQDGLRRSQSNHAGLSRLVADDRGAHNKLSAAIAEALTPDTAPVSHFTLGLSIPRASVTPPLILQFSTLVEAGLFAVGTVVPRVVVFIADSAAPVQMDEALLMRVYGLTKAEVRAAESLVGGGSIDEIAIALTISPNTLKTQLRAIYDKIGVNDRAALTKTLLALV